MVSVTNHIIYCCYLAGVTIEMSLSKDQTLTVVVTGKEEQVKKARREIMTKLQTQVCPVSFD